MKMRLSFLILVLSGLLGLGSAPVMAFETVVVDAGHGGNDEGTNASANTAAVHSAAFTLQLDTNVRPNANLVRAGLLYDMDQKKIVWEKKMDVAFPMASLTKMMVALITVEDIRSGKISWTDK
jgi:D-alanyl-D-alanine carboxypeptidase